jgi:hypothetical protein
MFTKGAGMFRRLGASVLVTAASLVAIGWAGERHCTDAAWSVETLFAPTLVCR